MLNFEILGPLRAARYGRDVQLGGTKQRAVLASLLLEPNRVVSSDRLVDALWGDAPPASARNSVHVYVSKLRRLLADEEGASEDLIHTDAQGYRVCVPVSALDSTAFERLARDARLAIGEGACAEARQLAESALALWRGPVLADLNLDHPAIARLEELRLEAITSRAEALLSLGGHVEALAELRPLVTDRPFDENLRGQLMRALYRAGRQTEALETYRELRTRLADELGLEPKAELRRLEQAILGQDPSLGPTLAVAPPPGRRTPIQPTDFPVSATPIVGRGRELLEAAELLEHHRVLTLLGTGGSGKTRLALELANAVAAHYPDGLFWVQLQALRDPAFVEGAIAKALGADGSPAEHIGERQMLVVLDTFEQLVEAAPTVASLAAQTPNARYLVTSRHALEISVEQRFEVGPLPAADAATLFNQRARSVFPSYRSTPDVDEICRKLDGLPLAIELAAARTIMLDPAALLARLDTRLSVLASRARDLPERQRTLRATIAWSYDLLSVEEQRIFRALGVFRGSFSLAAAEAVCGADLHRLESLVAKSLVPRPQGGRTTLLDTIREYALEQLNAWPESQGLRRRHSEFFLAVAESAKLNATGGGARLDIAHREQDNLRAALDWAVSVQDVTLGLALATAMDGFWVAHDPGEGMRWFGKFFALPEVEDAPLELRAHALRAFGGATDLVGDDEAAKRLYEQSFELFEQLGDERGMGMLLIRLAVQELRRGNVEEARVLVERSRGPLERTRDPWAQAQVPGLLGAVARDSGDLAGAATLIGESAALAAQAGVPWWKGGMLAELAMLSLHTGRIDEAERQARESLEIAEQVGDRPGCALGVGLLAVMAATQGQQERALRLWEAVAQVDAGSPLGGWRRHRHDLRTMFERHLGEAFSSRPPDQTVPSLDDAVSLALEPSQS